MEEKQDFFELNNKILQDFDKLMEKHLDKVEYLKIGKNITNVKLYNIIGLCYNVKTLEIDSDTKLDSNRVFASICKPNLLENLILKNVKLPTVKILNKFDNIHSIEMNSIKYSNVKDFLLNLGSKNIIETIKFEDVDFENQNMEFLGELKNLKTISINRLSNVKYDGLDFLSNNRKIKDISLLGNRINFSEISNLVKGKAKKNIFLKLQSGSEFISIENNEVSIKTNAKNLKLLRDNLSFNRINNLEISFNEMVDFEDEIKHLKKVKNDIKVIISDISKITYKQAVALMDQLDIKSVLVSNDEEKQEYEINSFIEIRKKIDEIIAKVSEELTDEEKFLWIYKYLLKTVEYDFEKVEEGEGYLLKALNENKALSKGFVELLNNCLIGLNYETNLMRGTIKKEKEKTWYWLQVKIGENWYNSDIALDAMQNLKMKNCLISNEKIEKIYNAETQSMYSVENVNPKFVAEFWKKDNINPKEKISIIQKIIQKIKALFTINKRLAEPENGVIGGEKEDDNT